MNTTSLNSREHKAQRLLAHYATCERLARYVLKGTNLQPHEDGKKISVMLFKIERLANAGATAWCNGENFLPGDRMRHSPYQFRSNENAWDVFAKDIADTIEKVFGVVPPEFFVNGDCRGYSLKIDNETPEGQALIEAVGLHRDMGGYGILSPEINGDR